MANLPNSLMQMFGGVAASMDQSDSKILSKMPNGAYGYYPTRKYMNQFAEQVKSLNPAGSARPIISSPVIEEEPKDTMDISKYIGKEKKKETQAVPNSQVEVIKSAIKPLNDQLEKVCILLGLIYQVLNAEQSQDNEGGEEEQPIHATFTEEEPVQNPEEEIAQLESQLNSLPKPPGVEELGQVDKDAIDI